MNAGGFILNPTTHQPGAWMSPHGIPVDLMVPESMAGGPGRRSARIPPHSRDAARRTVGLEAAIVDHAPMEVTALAEGDNRRYRANVMFAAGPGAKESLMAGRAEEFVGNPETVSASVAALAEDLLLTVG